MSYYSFPFVYDDRNSMNMQQPTMPATSPATQPMTEPMMSPQMQPMVQPMMNPQMQPMMNPQMQPMMQPMLNPQMQPMMQPMCPAGLPLMPQMEEMYPVEEIEAEPVNMSPDSRVPVLSNNPARPSITLFKELTGYPNYGNPSGNADILYTGDRGTWTFDIPAFLFVPGNLTAQIVIRAVLDDHYNVPVNRYSARIAVNGTNVHTGRVPLEHGTPAGQQFTNWRLLTFNVPNLRRNNRVVIVNTSNTGPTDWIAFDWMELRLIPR